MTITVEHADEHAETWHRMTWQQVGELVSGIGRAAGGPQWRQAALRADAPARDRLLHELLWYVEQEGFAVACPVTATDVGVFKALVDTLTVLTP